MFGCLILWGGPAAAQSCSFSMTDIAWGDIDPTLGQEQMDASQQAVLSKGDVNRYYRSLDKWHTEMRRPGRNILP